MSDNTHEIVQAIGFLSSEMTETRCQLRQALQDISDALNVPTPKRVRNEAARCGNCQYYDASDYPSSGGTRSSRSCAKDPLRVVTWSHMWCGQHPDFWKEA